jgi:hypothetical protein
MITFNYDCMLLKTRRDNVFIVYKNINKLNMHYFNNN